MENERSQLGMLGVPILKSVTHSSISLGIKRKLIYLISVQLLPCTKEEDEDILVNDARLKLFTKRSPSLENIPGYR